VLEPVSKSQRLFQLVVGIGPPGGQFPVDLGGLLDGGRRVLPPARVGQAGRQAIQRAGQVGPDRIRWVLVGRTPRSLMLFAVAAYSNSSRSRPAREQWNAHRRQRTGSWPPAIEAERARAGPDGIRHGRSIAG
jgi:hypothetical protein